MSLNWLRPPSHSHAGAGFWFCSCAGLPVVAADGTGAAAPKRTPLIIRGQRARTVDVHAHCYFQAALDLMGADAKAVLPPVKGVPEHFLQVDAQMAARLDAMERMGIDLQVLSINPFWYRQDRETAEAICRIHNEGFAELCAQHPKRFAAFASLAMQFPDLAVQQLEDAVKRQIAPGVSRYVFVHDDVEVDDPAVRLALAKLYEHHVRGFARALELVEQVVQGEGQGARGSRGAEAKRGHARGNSASEGASERAVLAHRTWAGWAAACCSSADGSPTSSSGAPGCTGPALGASPLATRSRTSPRRARRRPPTWAARAGGWAALRPGAARVSR